jgi:hypothetical protein
MLVKIRKRSSDIFDAFSTITEGYTKKKKKNHK